MDAPPTRIAACPEAIRSMSTILRCHHNATISNAQNLGKLNARRSGRLYLPMSTRPEKEAVGPWGLAKALDATKSRKGTCAWSTTVALSPPILPLHRGETVLILISLLFQISNLKDDSIRRPAGRRLHLLDCPSYPHPKFETFHVAMR